MTTLKELEKQRIEKIKSLNTDELNNYVKVLLHDLVKFSNDDYICFNDSAINDINYVFDKLDEISELTGVYQPITNEIMKYLIYSEYINNFLNEIENFKIRNRLLQHNIFSAIQNLILLGVFIREFHMISISDDSSVNRSLIETYKMVIPKMYNKLETDFEVINNYLYSADTLNDNIKYCKLRIKDLLDADSGKDKELKDLGYIDIYTEFIDENMKMLDLINQYNDNYSLLSDFNVNNVFEKHSENFYECFDDTYKFHVPFDDFMDKQPKFNIITGEFIGGVK